MSNRNVVSAQEEGVRWAVTAAAVALAISTHSKLGLTFRDASPDENKPFRSFPEFYPFYLSEHRNPISRGLHVTGTVLFTSVLLRYYRSHIPNIITSLSLSTILCEFLSPLSHGFVEFFVMIALFALFSSARNQSIPWVLPVIGYGFAWVGHFFFEKNQPATFIYPSYSLMGDFVMCFQTLTGQLPLTEELVTGPTNTTVT